jgi:DNA-binding CsgD family transcriptional regulator
MGDMAWATFEQHYPAGGDFDGGGMPSLVAEMRVFERHDGRWKIAFLAFLDSGSSEAGGAEIGLAGDGKVLWTTPDAAQKLKDDDDVVIRAGRLRFRESGADARLQAAIRWAAGLDSTYMSTHGAVPVVVGAGEGLPTRIFWVIADAGQIIFAFRSGGIAEQRLDMAALIYGLSPVQKQVARLVAEGLSLNEIGERLDITANTARTHLNRIFDKTGVRTQTALVRALLSAVSPL